jgi:ubiquinone/menaquinone biosynthesis C-methylase UbiE
MSTETRFVGSIPEIYDRHMGPNLFEPYAVDIALRLPAGVMHVLEVAAGTGRVTRQLLNVLAPDAKLIATDLNPPMLDIARRLIGVDPRVTWRQADAQALPLADGSVEAVVCQFGLMFVPDKLLAMREMKRVLAPGGILLLSVWEPLERNPASKLLHEEAYALSPDDPPSFMAVPFCAPDLGTLATDAGFRGVRVETVDKMGESESASHLATGFVRGNPLFNQLSEKGHDVAGFEARLGAKLAAQYGDKPCRTPLSARVLTAFA